MNDVTLAKYMSENLFQAELYPQFMTYKSNVSNEGH